MTLRNWRTAKHLTQGEVARRLGISLYRVCRIERGRVKRLDLCTALDIEAMTRGQVKPRDLVLT